MNPKTFPAVGGATFTMIAVLFLAGTARAQNLYFDPDHTSSPAGGSGEFNGTNNFDNGGTDQTFTNGANAYFDGAAGTVTVNAPVSANYLEVGVTSGTETIGTSGSNASQITLGPILENQPYTEFAVDAGSENVVFNSNVNINLENQTYNNEIAGNSATSGNVTFNGGFTFTNNTTAATDPSGFSTGSPGFNLNATAAGGTFTLNSSVALVETPVAMPTQNGNYPTLAFTGSSASNTLTLTSNASFIDTRVDASGGTVLDQGATYTYAPGGENANGPILVGNGGQYLADLAGMTVTDTAQFVSGGGAIGSNLTAVTTFSGQNSYNNGLAFISYAGSSAVNVTAAAGGRVNFTGDVQNGNGYAINKIGAGVVNLDDTGPRGEDQSGGFEIMNGTLLAGTTNAITGSGVTIDNVATAALVPGSQTYATLGGTGSVAALVTAAGANSVISPGDMTLAGVSQIGTLTLANGLMASSGATFNFDLNGAKANGFDTIAFNGSNLTLGGTVTFNFSNLGGTLDSGPYTLLTGFSPLITGGSSDAALFVLNAPAGYVATIDPSDLLPGATSFAVDFTAVAVPEPSTYALFGLGLAGICFIGGFRKHSA